MTKNITKKSVNKSKKSNFEQQKADLQNIIDKIDSLKRDACAFCLDDIKKGDRVMTFSCGHNNFHELCVNRWVESGELEKKCPNCRQWVDDVSVI